MPVDTTMFDSMTPQLIRFYEDAEGRLSTLMGRAGTSAFEYRRMELLLQQIDSIVRGLQEKQNGWSRRYLPRAYRHGMELTAESFRLRTLPAMTLMDRRGIEAAIARTMADTGEALQSIAPFARHVWTDTQQVILRETQLAEQIAAGRVEGLGPRELGRRLRQSFEDGATERLKGYVPDALRSNIEATAQGEYIGINCKDGVFRRYDMRSYSELVANNATREVATEGAISGVMSVGGDLVQISVHDNPCPEICLAIQGSIYSLTGETEGFPILTDDVRPPLHPRCLPPGMRVLTRAGLVPIERVQVGDEVLTHRGRWRAVTTTMARPFAGGLYCLNGLHATADHPVLTDCGWVSARGLYNLQKAGDKGRRRAALLNTYGLPSPVSQKLVPLGVAMGSTGILMGPTVHLNDHHRVGQGKVCNVVSDLLLKLKGVALGQQDAHRDGLMPSGFRPPSLAEASAHLLPHGGNARGVVVSHALLGFLIEGMAWLRYSPLPTYRSGGNASSAQEAKHRMGTASAETQRDSKFMDRQAVTNIAATQIVGERFAESCLQGGLVHSATEFFAACERASRVSQGASQPRGATGKLDTADWASNCHGLMLAHAGRFVKPEFTRRWYAGMVYNLSVAEDESYLAEGVVTHNCRHILVGVDADFLAERGILDNLSEFSMDPSAMAEDFGAYEEMLAA